MTVICNNLSFVSYGYSHIYIYTHKYIRAETMTTTVGDMLIHKMSESDMYITKRVYNFTLSDFIALYQRDDDYEKKNVKWWRAGSCKLEQTRNRKRIIWNSR